MNNSQESLKKEITAIQLHMDSVPVIKNGEQYEDQKCLFEAIRKIKKQINETFNPIIKKQKEAHSEAIAQKKRWLDPVEERENLLKSKLNRYISEQKRIAEEAEAKRRAEEERLRKEAEEKLLQEAEELKDEGASDQIVESVLNRQIIIDEPQTKVPEKPKFDNRILGKEKYSFEIINETILPRQYLKPDESKIKAQIKVTKGDTKIPGVRVYLDEF